MAKVPSTDADYVRSLERRIRQLENAIMPWKLGVGRFGDLVADNLDTGVRVTVAERESEPQNRT